MKKKEKNINLSRRDRFYIGILIILSLLEIFCLSIEHHYMERNIINTLKCNDTIMIINNTNMINNTVIERFNTTLITQSCDIEYKPNIALIRELKSCEEKINMSWSTVTCLDELHACNNTLNEIQEKFI